MSKLTFCREKDGVFRQDKVIETELPPGHRIFEFVGDKKIVCCPSFRTRFFYVLSLDNMKVNRFQIHEADCGLTEYQGSIRSYASCSSPSLFAASFNEGTFRIWDLDSNKVVFDNKKSNKFDRLQQVGSIVFSPDGKLMAIVGSIRDEGNRPFDYGAIEIYDVKNGFKPVKRINEYFVWKAVSFSPDNRYLAAKVDDYVILIDLEKDSSMVP